MPTTRIALLGDKDLGYVTHRALEAVVSRLPPDVRADWVGTDTSRAHALDAFDGVEGIELPGHPFFVATLFQPQIGALSGAPLHPLIAAFAEAAARVRVDG